MFRFVLIYFIFGTLAFAQNAKGIFSIVVEGKRSELSYIKKRSELSMARSTKYCRGSMMPKAAGKWSCKSSAPKVSSCVLEYKCQFVNKSFNRLTETRRIRKQLSSMPAVKSKYSITLIYEDKKEVMKQLGGGKFVVDSAKHSQKSFSHQKLAASSKTYSSGNPSKKISQSKKKARSTQKVQAPKKSAKAKKIEQEELAELAALKEEDFKVEHQSKEEEWVLEKNKKTDGREEYQLYKKDEKYSDQEKAPTGERNQWTSFALSYISVSDSLDNSLATFDAAWTPFMWFSNSWGLRGQLGVHQFKLSETATTLEESFLIYDIGGFGLYRVGNLFAELGFGLQKWNNSTGDSFNSLSLGAGYIFEYYKFKYIDRIQVGFSSVSNEISTKEFRLSMGLSF
ncbi:hypothetical protein [Halobacteriovorax sp. HLS]|uniref:hypothetical protein n=1 Tax=Halobacteriovorax sp. HLS TaxID=2234000 RepID=UPI000FD6EDF0|nr:hypothetical protein [Halobacteriovorax sp. HLS]